jgi:hypothetical protein
LLGSENRARKREEGGGRRKREKEMAREKTVKRR